MKNKNMKDLYVLTKRHTKLFFKDKSAFLPALITPVILIVLFMTFLKSVYTSVLLMHVPEGVVLEGSLINAFTGSWLISSILGVSCVTIAFCTNIIMAGDKANKSINDFYVLPVKKSTISLSYFFSNFISTLLVCLVCMALGFVYFALAGWFFTAIDVLLITAVVFMCCLFGSTLACVVEYFISSIGGISAIATLVSSMYGFIAGAYMPLSQFSPVVRDIISFLPGTYTLGLLRNYYMRGIVENLSNILPEQSIANIKNNFDGILYFQGNPVQIWQMFLIVGLSIAVFLTLYLSFVFMKKRKKRKIA
ncbi:MAG: ABC transporter permease [Clostridia bacterium]|nr:ABC transporter permease [Clostridia bacterium]